MNNMKSVQGVSRIAALTLLAAAGLASAPAFAADGVKVKRSVDPQLTYVRLQRAAAQLCGSVDRHDLSRYTAWSRCYQRNLQAAIEQMNEPALVAIHARRLAAGKRLG